MFKIEIKRIGNCVSGDVLDCNKKALERTLQAHDPFLYIKWNSKKLKGYGCWEIRRKPEFNSAIDIAEYDGATLIKLGEYESPLVHHVLDCAFLNYDQVRKIKEMDSFKYGDAARWQAEVEYRHEQAKQVAKDKTKQLIRESSRTFKNEIRAFKDYILNGGNPHLIAAYWDHIRALE